MEAAQMKTMEMKEAWTDALMKNIFIMPNVNPAITFSGISKSTLIKYILEWNMADKDKETIPSVKNNQRLGAEKEHLLLRQ